MDYLKYTPILIPIVSGYYTASICKSGPDDGKTVKFRPPPAVFGIVWPILYLMIGLAWFRARTVPENILLFGKSKRIFVDVFFVSLIICLNAWLYTYSSSCLGNKKQAVWVLGLCVMFALLSQGVSGKNKILLVPLITWLGVALLMNATEVQHTDK